MPGTRRSGVRSRAWRTRPARSRFANIVEDLLAELSLVHREVVELAVFDQLSAAQTSREVTAKFRGEKISADNVYKIAQRFRDTLRDRLESEDGS